MQLTNGVDQIATTGIHSSLEDWVAADKKLPHMLEKYKQMEAELKAYGTEIQVTMDRLLGYRPNIVGEASTHLKPVRIIDPEDGRPFAISSGRAIKDAKRRGEPEAKAREIAQAQVEMLATNKEYKLPRAPKAAIDRIEIQIKEVYHSDNE
jgi:hypothetical protein